MRLSRLYTPDCYPDDEDCSGETWTDVVSLAFDPTAPASRVLLLTRQYVAGTDRLDSFDIATGTTAEIATIQTTWPGFEGSEVIDFSVDTERLRALVTTVIRRRFMPPRFGVIAIDLVTGEQTLLYDGAPAADGAQLACNPNPAFDYIQRRLLLVEPDGSSCTGGIFAVDADTGALTHF